MGNLNNLYISASFQSLLHLGNDSIISSSLVGVQDGFGNSIGIAVNSAGDLSLSGSLTASLQQGYVWVGNSLGRTTTVPTSSFGGGGSTNTGSLMVTGSASGNVLTFTKGDASQFSLTVATGSGGGGSTFPFTGSAVITGSLGITGSLTISGSGILNGSPLVKSNQTGSFVTNIYATATPLQFEYDLGNGGTNTVTLVASGGGIDTGSFATTGSNQFTGNQTITGSSRQVGLSIEESGTSGPGNFSRFFIGSKGNGTGNLIISSSANDRYIELDAGSGWMEVYANQVNFNNNVSLRSRTDARNIFTDLGNGYTAQFDIISGSNANISGSLYVGGNKQFNVGAFQSNITQSGSANVSQSMAFEVTDISKGVSIVSNSRITLANSGTYNIQFSAQFDRISGSGNDTVHVWLKKNGVNYNASAGVLTVSGGANQAKALAAWNYVVESTSSDYWELCWQTSDTNIKIITFPASGNIPVVPSVILTVTQVR
jgi:hypothetical protein